MAGRHHALERLGDDERIDAEEQGQDGQVVGMDAHGLYQWISGEAGEAAAPKWNFHKYLIGKDGSLKGAWPSRVRPGSSEITGAIEAELKA